MPRIPPPSHTRSAFSVASTRSTVGGGVTLTNDAQSLIILHRSSLPVYGVCIIRCKRVRASLTLVGRRTSGSALRHGRRHRHEITDPAHGFKPHTDAFRRRVLLISATLSNGTSTLVSG